MANHVTSKLRPLFKCHGGKAYLARRIVGLMPPHKLFIEPFLGGGSVTLNNALAERFVCSDIDPETMCIWETARRKGRELRNALSAIEYREKVFLNACEYLEAVHFLRDQICYDVTAASASIVRSRFSRGGMGRTFAWSDRQRGGLPGDENAWKTFVWEDLPAILERVKGFEFRLGDFAPIIKEYEYEDDCLIYCDPPYLHETRTAKRVYRSEMSIEDHLRLLKLAEVTPAKMMISGYRSDLYDDHLAGWSRHEFDLPNHSGQGERKQRRTECLWCNF